MSVGVSHPHNDKGTVQKIKAPPHHSYKLLVDPLLVKGKREKEYRYDGVQHGGMPPILVRDPRPPFIKKKERTEAFDLRVPRFEVKI